MKIPKYFKILSHGNLLFINLHEDESVSGSIALNDPRKIGWWPSDHLFIEKKYDWIIVPDDYQEWFISEFKNLVPYVTGWSPEFSHLNLANKFGLLSDYENS